MMDYRLPTLKELVMTLLAVAIAILVMILFFAAA